LLLPSQAQRFQPISDQLDVVAFGNQDPFEGRRESRIVLHDENPRTVHVSRYIRAA
jgi:hypothetical protein